MNKDIVFIVLCIGVAVAMFANLWPSPRKTGDGIFKMVDTKSSGLNSVNDPNLTGGTLTLVGGQSAGAGPVGVISNESLRISNTASGSSTRIWNTDSGSPIIADTKRRIVFVDTNVWKIQSLKDY
jgi:hypothetical protein